MGNKEPRPIIIDSQFEPRVRNIVEGAIQKYEERRALESPPPRIQQNIKLNIEINNQTVAINNASPATRKADLVVQYSTAADSQALTAKENETKPAPAQGKPQFQLQIDQPPSPRRPVEHVPPSRWRPTDNANPVSSRVDQAMKLAGSFLVEKHSHLCGTRLAEGMHSEQVLSDTQTSSTYKGQVDRNNLPHGYGTLTTLQGEVTDGFFERGSPAFYIRRFFASGRVQAGEYKQGKFCNKGYELDDEATKRTDYSDLSNGRWEGQVTQRRLGPEPRVLFKGFMKNGLKHGPVEIFYDEKSKTTYQGTYFHGHLEGQGRRTWTNGQTYEGNFEKSVENGPGTITFVDGRKWTGPFKNGAPDGVGLLYPVEDSVGRSITFVLGNKQ